MTLNRKNIFILFTIFMIIMACAPAMVTPVPTLDPNIINTRIVQTADAAMAQTQAAIPPTSTITPTLRSTFTPESTFTLVPVVTFPTATLTQKLQYFRVKHDSQLEEYNFKSRTASNNWSFGAQTPEVVPLFLSPKPASGTNRTVLDSSWGIYLNALNGNDDRKLRYIKADNTALFDGKGFPYLESKTMGGNVITLDAVQGNWGLVHTLDFKNPGELSNMTYQNRPDLVQTVVIVKWNRETKTTSWLHAPPGPLYWPLVSDKPIWISMDWVEPFPAMPMIVTSLFTQEIKTTPDLKAPSTGSEFTEGVSERITQYFPAGSNVWARLSRGGWILLFFYSKNGPTYPTTWSMETLPPPP